MIDFYSKVSNLQIQILSEGLFLLSHFHTLTLGLITKEVWLDLNGL